MTSSIWLVDNPARTLQAGARLAGPRSESYRWELLDLAGSVVGDLDGVSGGSVEQSSGSTLRASASLTCEGGDVNWLRSLVRCWYRADFPDGTFAQWPLGTFIPTSPNVDYGDGTATRDVEAMSLLQVLEDDVTEKTTTTQMLSSVTDRVRAIITLAAAGVNGGKVAGTDSDRLFFRPMVWEPGLSRLRIVNDMLASINYFALAVDGLGTFRMEPYVPPSGRAVAWDFRDDESAIYLPQFTHERDFFAVPNKVVAWSQGDGTDGAALMSTATNMDPADPLSYPGRGRWVTHFEDNVEASSQAVLDEIAQRRLRELSSVSSVVVIQHLPVPLTPNDVVTFTNAAGLDLRGVVEKTSVSCVPGSLQSTTIREVTS